MSGEITKLEGKLDEVDGQINTTKDSQKKLNSQWDYATTYIKDYSDTAVKETPKVESAVSTALGNIKTAVANFKLPDIKITFKAVTDSVDAAFKNYGMFGNIKLPTPNISAYATGGLPSVGELFVANEAGPELVGKMGNSSVVANNNQITEGIKQAVIEALMTTSKNGSNERITVESNLFIDSEKMYSISQKGKAKHERRFQTT